jgi:MFS family permease
MTVYLDLLRHNRNYRNLWLGNVISLLGDWFNLIASASLIARLTSSGSAISYLFLARFLPLFLFSPIAGVLADRYSRRTILIVTDVGRAVVVLGFLLVRRPEDVWVLYVLTISQFILSSLFTPARSALLANVVAPNELVTANALDSVTWSTMLALGALLGGAAAALFGIATSFLLDSLTFLLSAFFISRLSLPRRVRAEGAAVRQSGGWTAYIDGLRYLKGAPFILGVSLVKGGGSLAWGAINVLEVTFAEQIFPLGENGTITLGLLYTATGIGTGIGPLVLRRWLGDAPLRLRWAIVLGFGLLTSGILTLSLAPTLPLFLLGTLVRTLGSGTIWVFSAALMQMILPDEVRGRVFSFEFAFLTLTQSLSVFWAGFAQDNLGLNVREVMAIMGGLALVAGLAWLLFHLRHRAHPPQAMAGPTSLD